MAIFSEKSISIYFPLNDSRIRGRVFFIFGTYVCASDSYHLALSMFYQHLWLPSFYQYGRQICSFILFHFWNRFPPSFQRYKKKLHSYRGIPGILFCDNASLGHLRNQWWTYGEEVFELFGSCWCRQEGDACLNIFCRGTILFLFLLA